MALITRERSQYALSGHSDAVLSVQFHPTLNYLATASSDGTVLCWRLDSGIVSESGGVGESGGGGSISSSGATNVGVMRLSRRHPNGAITPCPVLSLAWTDVKSELFVALPDGGKALDLETNKQEQLFWSEGVTNAVAFDEYSELSAFGGDEGIVRLCKGSRVVSSFPVLRRRGGQQQPPVHQPSFPITALSFSRSQLFVGGVDGCVHWYDIRQTNEPLHSFESHSDVIQSTALSPGSNMLATRGLDGALCVWNLAGEPELVGAAEAAPGGKYLSACAWGADDWIATGKGSVVSSYAVVSPSLIEREFVQAGRKAPQAGVFHGVEIAAFDSPVVGVDVCRRFSVLCASSANGAVALCPFRPEE